ncbi:MAG: UPF0149 family protein [Alicycliphilus sp.]|jgi:uncharacterized protein|uniref:UPF0149 family protein n=1 Tax=Diaphorobacter limosus TaxID=3036128 RepID=A0ABZ0J1Z6_9BURK|nr:UPF0149 family protein [Diaphorobacter sp. Y-1]MBP7328263.1 UPF0149 family protein [Alicycliphilus sp.]WOO31656.1 UPF0149 family protein [Diaphorobacter sp. Y-1]
MTTIENNRAAPDPALGPDALDELDLILEDLRTREDEVPQWEFCDGFLTALVCTRRAISVAEWLPMLVGDGLELGLDAAGALPLMPPFKDLAQQQRFVHWCQLRSAEVAAQLDAQAESLDADDAFQPEVLDMRGAIASLPEDERAEMEGQPIPSFGQIWALGFMFAVENWDDEWQAPRDKEAAQWLDDALQAIVALAEDDTGKPTICMYDEDGPPSTSQQRLEDFGEAIWAVYDLRQLWRSLGPRVQAIVHGPQPGRNDPCPCGSGKKYKKCCGA